MTAATFLIADLHLGHKGMCEFTRADGSKLRPWSTPEEMDAELVRRWNETVRPQDKVYVVGDVAMHPRNLITLGRMHGDKVLIKGNHDQAKLSQYAPYFRDIRAYWQLGRCLLSHIPIHPESLSRWRANIHGHTHYRRVMDGDKPDPRYICVSVEQTDYRPILLDRVLEQVPERA
jgi:calcineurin-like phosphoesterase family protein